MNSSGLFFIGNSKCVNVQHVLESGCEVVAVARATIQVAWCGKELQANLGTDSIMHLDDNAGEEESTPCMSPCPVS